MDSHLFRLLGSELLQLLDGARVEKIHAPAPELLVLSIFNYGKKQRIAFFINKQNPAIYFVSTTLTNPQQPDSSVMRMRKYFAGRRFSKVSMDWIKRRFIFAVPARPALLDGSACHEGFRGFSDDERRACWLVIDLAEGATLTFKEPELSHNSSDPASPWPDYAVLDELCKAASEQHTLSGEKDITEKPWARYPVLTPLLRKSLAALDIHECKAIMADLEYESMRGTGTLCLYRENSDAGKPILLSAWPLPIEVLPKFSKSEPEFIEISEKIKNTLSIPESFPGLVAASSLFEPKINVHLGLILNKETVRNHKSAVRKQERLLKTLLQEEKRLHGLLAMRRDAIKIQANLWKFSSDARLEKLTVQDDNAGEEWTIVLNPLKSIRENMAYMFHQSGRGARGLAIIKDRMSNLKNAISLSSKGYDLVLPDHGKGKIIGSKRDSKQLPHGNGRQKFSDVTRGMEEKSDKLMQRFKSSDGFLFLRGRSADGNHAILKKAAPYDLWFHAKDGPSAHLICKLPHAGAEIPDRTLLEAATLVGLKSWQKNAGKAEVMFAEARDVHPAKGGKSGAVRVDKIKGSILVGLDAGLEAMLGSF